MRDSKWPLIYHHNWLALQFLAIHGHRRTHRPIVLIELFIRILWALLCTCIYVQNYGPLSSLFTSVFRATRRATVTAHGVCLVNNHMIHMIWTYACLTIRYHWKYSPIKNIIFYNVSIFQHTWKHFNISKAWINERLQELLCSSLIQLFSKIRQSKIRQNSRF